MHLPALLLLTLTFALGARAASGSSPASASALCECPPRVVQRHAQQLCGAPERLVVRCTILLPCASSTNKSGIRIGRAELLLCHPAVRPSLLPLTLFCPQRKPYAAALLSCLTACPAGLLSAEALVEHFCAAARKPTSISFHSFVTSSSSAASAPSSAPANSGLGSNTVTAPASSSSTSSNAPRTNTAHSLDSVTPTAAHVLLPTPPRRRAPIVLLAPPCPCPQPSSRPLRIRLPPTPLLRPE
ncbi:hypothetical protein FB451DRAFT_1467626 [Mycena latifolia]|nr:hypothetical protein FB451DRAFT_1467626 [Mycena latifolia]